MDLRDGAQPTAVDLRAGAHADTSASATEGSNISSPTAPPPPKGIAYAENSLSRMIFCLQGAVLSAALTGCCSAGCAYAAVRLAEARGFRRRGMKWIVPGAAGLLGVFLGSRVGLYNALEDLDERRRLRQREV